MQAGSPQRNNLLLYTVALLFLCTVTIGVWGYIHPIAFFHIKGNRFFSVMSQWGILTVYYIHIDAPDCYISEAELKHPLQYNWRIALEFRPLDARPHYRYVSWNYGFGPPKDSVKRFLGNFKSKTTPPNRFGTDTPGDDYWYFHIHFWILSMISGILLALAGRPAYRRYRAARRLVRGCCPNCNYDLRSHASGEKCPECGTLIPNSSVATNLSL